jgi:hypothetical protein
VTVEEGKPVSVCACGGRGRVEGSMSATATEILFESSTQYQTLTTSIQNIWNARHSVVLLVSAVPSKDQTHTPDNAMTTTLTAEEDWKHIC